MYTKTGLSALAIAGVAFGAIGLLTGAGNASPADCRAPSTSVAAPAAGGGNGSSSSSATSPAAKQTPVKTVTNRAKNKTAGGTSGGKGSNGSGSGGANVTVPADGTAPSAGTTPSGSSDQPFLDLQGNSQPVGTTNGAPTVPSSGTHVIGRSSSLGSLIQVTGRANSGR
jgi:hypothetical protein